MSLSYRSPVLSDVFYITYVLGVMLACDQRKRRTALVATCLVILVGICGLGVDVNILSTAKEGSPGTFVTHVFAVVNDLPTAETYTLDFTAPTGWGVLGAPTSIALQPGEEGTLFVTVTIPPGALAGDYELKLMATSVTDPLDTGSEMGIVIVTPRNEIELLAPTGASIAPGDSMTYEFTLVNRGNMQDSYALGATSSRGLPITLSHTSIDLAPQERLNFTVVIAVPAATDPGRDVLTVFAESVLFEAVDADAVVFTSVLPPAPDAVGGTVMEELPARIRLSIDKNVMTGLFDSQLTFSTSGQILGGYFSSFFSLLDPFGPTIAKLSSFSILYRREPTTFAIGNVSKRLTDLLRLSCTGGSLGIDAELYDLSIIGGGSNGETRFAGHASLGPEVANAGIGYLGIRDGVSVSKSIWTLTAHAEPLEDWTMTLEGSLGLDGMLTSRAIFFNTTIDSSGYFFSGSAFSVGTFFPGQRADTAGIEVSQRLRLTALSLSASLTHEWDNVIRDPLVQTRIQDDLGFNLTATPLEDGPTLSSTLDFTWDRYADATLKSDVSTLLSVSMTETSGTFPYALSGKVLEQIDHVLGSHVRTATYAQGVGLSVDDFYLYFQVTEEQSFDIITDTELSSSADFSLRFRPEAALHEASITFRNTYDDFDLSTSFFIQVTDDLDITFDGSISWDRHDASQIGFGWGIAFNANVTIPLPFLVTKGRIEGRAFIDRDGDGLYGLNDEPMQGIVVGTNQTDVSTNAEGYFRFPPMYPGDVTLTADQLPLEAAVGDPVTASVLAGETVWINLPLQPVTVVSGEVFEDNNRDGTRDADEGGFAQVRVVLQSEDDGSSRDAYTDLSGSFTISDVLPGAYTLFVGEDSLPDRFEFTTADTALISVGAWTPDIVSFGGFIREREVVITFQPPTADYQYSPEMPIAGSPVSFDASDSFDFDGIIVSYAWDFNGDGSDDSDQPFAEYTFVQPGTFNVALTVTDDAGNGDTVIREITVSGAVENGSSNPNQRPIAAFSILPTQPLAGETITFDGTASSDIDGSIANYSWDFDGDGDPDASQSIATHVFAAPGTFGVSLTVVDDTGNLDTLTRSIIVGESGQSTTEVTPSIQPPIASFQISPATPAPEQLIQLNGTSSLDLDGTIVAFAWDFDEDALIDSTAPIAEISYASTGTYNITLTVTDNDGNTDTITQSVSVTGESQPPENGENPQNPPDDQALVEGAVPPIADFAFLPVNPDAGAIMLFNATLSTDPDGEIASYSWDFDADGEADSFAAIVDHSFAEDGVYPVTLTVTDDSGSSDALTLSVIVGAGESEAEEALPLSIPPIAAIDYTPENPQTGSVVVFNATRSTDADGQVESYAWDFDNDEIIDSTAAIAEFVFLTVGTQDVSLTVTDNSGSSDTLTVQVTVEGAEIPEPAAASAPPVANYEYSPTQPSAGDLVLFNGLLSTDSDGEITAYAWDFDDDGVIDSTDAFAEFTYPAAGTFNATLTVTDSSGSTDSFIQAILVGVPSTTPPASPPSSFQPPVADFSYMPSQPTAGELVLFNGTFSWDFDGEIATYAWDFNNDGSSDANTALAEYIFPVPGTVTVSLTVTDNSGASDTLSIPIQVD